MFIRASFLSICLAVFLAPTVSAETVRTYDIGWSGSNSIFLEGQFSFDASLIGDADGDGVVGETGDDFIDEGDLAAFQFSIFRDTASGPVKLGGWLFDATSPTSTFNFNFDTSTEQFLIGGNSSSGTGQDWGELSIVGGSFAGVQFLSGSANQVVNDFSIGMISSQPIDTSTLQALNGRDEDIIPPVPLPSGLPLLGAGLLCFGLMRKRKAA